MSKRSASRSTILPLPSSPHWAPMTAITMKQQRSEIRSQTSEKRNSRFQIRNSNSGSQIQSRTQNRRGSFSEQTKPRPKDYQLRSGGGADVLVQHARDGALGSRSDDALFFAAI